MLASVKSVRFGSHWLRMYGGCGVVALREAICGLQPIKRSSASRCETRDMQWRDFTSNGNEACSEECRQNKNVRTSFRDLHRSACGTLPSFVQLANPAWEPEIAPHTYARHQKKCQNIHTWVENGFAAMCAVVSVLLRWAHGSCSSSVAVRANLSSDDTSCPTPPQTHHLAARAHMPHSQLGSCRYQLSVISLFFGFYSTRSPMGVVYRSKKWNSPLLSEALHTRCRRSGCG